MTSKFNPYKQWLGLKTQFIKPHYFELFDLSPSLKSQDEITEIVDAAAKRCLKLLAEVPAGENDRLVEEIQERVLRAQKILSNPKTRLAYHKPTEIEDPGTQHSSFNQARTLSKSASQRKACRTRKIARE